MRKLILSIVFLLVMAGVPSAAHAVVANIKLLDSSLNTIQTFGPFGPSGTLPLSLSGTYGAFTISGEAAFISDATNPGQLKLRGPGGSGKFVVQNNGSVYARILIETFQTNAATDPARTTICAGHSGDGWFSGTASTSNNPRSFFSQTMNVVFTTNSGSLIVNPVNGSNPSTCDDPLVSGKSPLRYELGATGQTSKTYNPQNPKQVFQRVPTCNNCALGAKLEKFITLGLPAGGVNNHVGTHFGSICEVPGRKPRAADFFDCNVLLGSLFISKEARFVVGNSTLKEGDQGKILGDLLGGENFNVVDVKPFPTTGLPQCELFAGDNTTGGLAVHSVLGDFNGDGILDLRMQFENSEVNPQFGDGEVTLKCQAAISVKGVDTVREIITADPVTVTH